MSGSAHHSQKQDGARGPRATPARSKGGDHGFYITTQAINTYWRKRYGAKCPYIEPLPQQIYLAKKDKERAQRQAYRSKLTGFANAAEPGPGPTSLFPAQPSHGARRSRPPTSMGARPGTSPSPPRQRGMPQGQGQSGVRPSTGAGAASRGPATLLAKLMPPPVGTAQRGGPLGGRRQRVAESNKRGGGGAGEKMDAEPEEEEVDSDDERGHMVAKRIKEAIRFNEAYLSKLYAADPAATSLRSDRPLRQLETLDPVAAEPSETVACRSQVTETVTIEAVDPSKEGATVGRYASLRVEVQEGASPPPAPIPVPAPADPADGGAAPDQQPSSSSSSSTAVAWEAAPPVEAAVDQARSPTPDPFASTPSGGRGSAMRVTRADTYGDDFETTGSVAGTPKAQAAVPPPAVGVVDSTMADSAFQLSQVPQAGQHTLELSMSVAPPRGGSFKQAPLRAESEVMPRDDVKDLQGLHKRSATMDSSQHAALSTDGPPKLSLMEEIRQKKALRAVRPGLIMSGSYLSENQSHGDR
jgi:hypothetical protein